MADGPDKLAALTAAATALAGAGVPFALVGGIAVGIHSGSPRATLDVDLAVPSGAERERAGAALSAAGFRQTGSFAHSTNFRHASGEPVQLIFDAGFDEMIARAEPIEVRGVRVPIVSKPDLIAMKERSAADPAHRRSKALQDRADLALLRGDVPDPDEGW